MRNTNRTFKETILMAVLLFVFMSFLTTLFVDYFAGKMIEIRLTTVTKKVETTFKTFFNIKEEAKVSYYLQLSSDKELIRIMRMAKSGIEKDLVRARAELFRHLWGFYQYLKQNKYVDQFHFVLPNNKSFLRFHQPDIYGDDLSKIRKTFVKVNTEKKPQFGFELGVVASSMRFVFPLLSPEGEHLGAFEVSVGTYDIIEKIKQITPSAKVYMLIRDELVLKKVYEPFRQYFLQVPGLNGWRLEVPGRDITLLKQEDLNLLARVAKTTKLNQELATGKNFTLYTKVRGTPYEVTTIAFKEFNGDKVAAILIYINTSKQIETIEEARKVYLMVGYFFNLLASILVYLILVSRKKLLESHRELEAITSSLGGAVVVYDAYGKVFFVNKSATEILGYSKEEIMDSVFHDLVHYHTSDLEHCPIYRAVLSGEKYDAEDSFIRKDGTLVSVYVSLRPLFLDNKRVGGILNFYDIGDWKKKEEEVFQMAITDYLTGLYNRRYLETILKSAEDKANNRDITFSVIIIDIDNFKKINDTYGHNMGDKVLVAIADVLRNTLRISDIPARWGGEEFLVFLEQTNHNGAMALAERIRKGVEKTEVNGIKVTVSLGVAQHKKGDSYMETIERADMALYDAKKSGKNRVVLAQ